MICPLDGCMAPAIVYPLCEGHWGELPRALQRELEKLWWHGAELGFTAAHREQAMARVREIFAPGTGIRATQQILPGLEAYGAKEYEVHG